MPRGWAEPGDGADVAFGLTKLNPGATYVKKRFFLPVLVLEELN